MKAPEPTSSLSQDEQPLPAVAGSGLASQGAEHQKCSQEQVRIYLDWRTRQHFQALIYPNSLGAVTISILEMKKLRFWKVHVTSASI